MKLVKGIVILMGFAIVVMAGMLIYGFTNKSSIDTGKMADSSFGNGKSISTFNVVLKSGSSIVSQISMGSQYLALTVKSTQGGVRILFVNPRTGKVGSQLILQAPGPKTATTPSFNVAPTPAQVTKENTKVQKKK